MPFNQAKTQIQEALNKGKLVLILGNCFVKYEGRAASKLSNGDRLLIIKPDGTFLLHQKTKAKAINYQGPGAIVDVKIEEEKDAKESKKQKEVLIISATRLKPKEVIEAKFKSISFFNSFEMKDDQELRLFGSERQLSDLLMQDLQLIEEGLIPLQQESPLHKGTIDILAQDKDKNLVVIEVKRRDAHLNAVSQLKRYVDEIGKRKNIKTRGILCSPSISETALKLLEENNLEYYKLDYEIGNPSAKIIGLQKKQNTLNEFV